MKSAHIKFVFTQFKSSKPIEIHFGSEKVFYSCKQGSDLFDFDALLEYLVPDIEFESINRAKARLWEQKLYKMLATCKEQTAALTSLQTFADKVKREHTKTNYAQKNNRQGFMHQLEKALSKKLGIITTLAPV